MGCAKVSLRDDSHLLHVCEQHALVSNVCWGDTQAAAVERQRTRRRLRERGCAMPALLPAAPVSSSIDFELFEYNV